MAPLMDTRKIDFGTVLKRLRKMQRLTQEGLAYNSSLNRSFISSLERNLKNPSLCTINALAAGLGMMAWELLKEVEEHSIMD
jgi:transcriptional regulator with XRE-family HTH domain